MIFNPHTRGRNQNDNTNALCYYIQSLSTGKKQSACTVGKPLSQTKKVRHIGNLIPMYGEETNMRSSRTTSVRIQSPYAGEKLLMCEKAAAGIHSIPTRGGETVDVRGSRARVQFNPHTRGRNWTIYNLHRRCSNSIHTREETIYG